VNRSYRLGLLIVTSAVLLAAGLAPFVPARKVRPAGEDLSLSPLPLGPFRLRESSGRSVSESDLAGQVWIASFIFTRCPSSCPRISAQMATLQRELSGSRVRLVSVSVDPEHDTAEVLKTYADRFRADPARWWFLTGPQADVYGLILDRFKLHVANSTDEDRRTGAEAVAHSDRFVLVDRGNRVIGYFASTDPTAVRELLSKARQRDLGWVLRLPTVNAALNGSCALLLLAAWGMIRTHRVRAHASLMIACLAGSALFLTCYLIYHYHVGSVPFRGEGVIRSVYFTVLLSHTVLAISVVPLIIVTLIRALRSRFAAHARIAQVTFPIWLYVSVTGVIVYLMLYQMSVSVSVG
jgi:protein SCO1